MAGLGHVVLLLAIALPLAGGLAALRPRPRSGNVAVGATALALAAGAATALQSGIGDGPEVALGTGLLLEADRVGALLLVFVLALTLVAQSFAVRALRGDACRQRFFAASGGAASATGALVVAADLWLLVGAWIAVSIATVLLLRHDGRPTAVAASRRAAWCFLVGDLALVAGALAVTTSRGRITVRPDELASLVPVDGGALGGGTALGVLAIGAVIAAIARCALPPAQAWLPMSVAAPTPSSAILHAGIVNGGGILLVRLAPAVGASRAATSVAIVSGCLGVMVAGAVARTRPDVKGALAWSTVAQMGFMVVQCVIGLLGLAIVHMVAHGAYKANLFLGSGSTLAHTGPQPRDGAPGGLGRVALSTAVTAVTVGAAWLVVRPSALSGVVAVVVVAFVAATVGQAVAAWLRARQHRSRVDVAAVVALVLATTGALAIADLVKAWVAPSLPVVDPPLALAGALALGVSALAGWLLATVARDPRPGVRALADRAYVWATYLADPARVAPVMVRTEVRR